MPTNQILQFCPTDTGSNLLTQSAYLAATDRTTGNQPGVASSKLNNKAVRQAAFVASQMAQMLSNQLGADVLDNGVAAQLLAQFLATLKPYAPKVTKYTSGTSTHNMNYIFFIATGSATAGATYTNNAVTFTVVATVASGTEVQMTGNGDPSTGGTLTKASGSGDATITFYAVRKPLYYNVLLVGGGGGGGGSGTNDGTAAGAGGDTTFGSGFLSGSGGGAGGRFNGNGLGGTGGGASLGSAVGQIFAGTPGHSGQGAIATFAPTAGNGGSSPFGGGGVAGTIVQNGGAAATNSGSGGGGGGSNANASAGGGGGSGGFVNALVFSPLSSYSAVIGAAGSAGAAGTSGQAGGAGAAGIVIVTEHFQ